MKCKDCKYMYTNETMNGLYACANINSKNFGEYIFNDDACGVGEREMGTTDDNVIDFLRKENEQLYQRAKFYEMLYKKTLNEKYSPLDFSLMMLCAFRYALGRMTYVPSSVTNFIKIHISMIWDKDIHIMIKEITDYENKKWLGMDFDEKMWLEFRDFLIQEKEKRNQEGKINEKY